MAKADKTRQSEKLSIEQLRAVDCLVTGQTDEEAAAAVGRARQTICLWRLHNPYFQAELNRRRNELWESATDKLRSLVTRALATLEQALDSKEHGVQAALAILKKVDLPLHAIGARDPEEIIREAAKRQEEAERAEVFHFGPSLAAVRADLLKKARAGDATESDGVDA